MQLTKLGSRAWRGLVIACTVAFLIALLWLNHQGNSVRHPGLLTALSIVVLLMLSSTGVVPLPQGVNVPFLNVWPRLSDSVKAGVSFGLIFVWTPIAMELTPDTLIGVIVMLVPDGVFALAALVYLSNGLSANLK